MRSVWLADWQTISVSKYVLSEGFQSFHSLIRLLKAKMNILQSCVSVMLPFPAISETFKYIDI